MLENLGIIFGIIGVSFGVIVGIVSGIFKWRKNLLNTAFETYEKLIDVKIEKLETSFHDHKHETRTLININEEGHRKTSVRMVELYEKILEQVTTQTGLCRVIQATRKGETKADDMWRQRIEEELTEVQNDVKHIKKVINHDGTI